MQVVQNLTGCCETWLAWLDVEELGWVEMSLKLCTGCGVTGWTCTGKYPRVGLTGQSLCRSLARLQCPYRVLFRRNISLIKGCVKLTRPFLDMLVTRSLWSKMCKSMLSAGFFFFGPGETRWLSDAVQWYAARPRRWRALPALGRPASRCDRLAGDEKTSDRRSLNPAHENSCLFK